MNDRRDGRAQPRDVRFMAMTSRRLREMTRSERRRWGAFALDLLDQFDAVPEGWCRSEAAEIAAKEEQA